MTALADTPLAPAAATPAPATPAAATPAPATPAASDAAAPSVQRGSRPLAVATVAAPLLLAGGVVAHPDDTQGVEHTLSTIGGDASLAWTVTHLVEPFAWVLLGITLLLTLPRMAGARGGTLLRVAGVLSAIGYSAVGFIVYAHGETFRFMAATDVEPTVYEPLFEQFEQAMPLAALPSMLGRLGLLLAIIGLLRARTVPVWAALLLVPTVVLMGSAGLLPLALGVALFFGPLVVGLAVCAHRVARTGGPALGNRC